MKKFLLVAGLIVLTQPSIIAVSGFYNVQDDQSQGMALKPLAAAYANLSNAYNDVTDDNIRDVVATFVAELARLVPLCQYFDTLRQELHSDSRNAQFDIASTTRQLGQIIQYVLGAWHVANDTKCDTLRYGQGGLDPENVTSVPNRARVRARER
jgi:hypothetical protein